MGKVILTENERKNEVARRELDIYMARRGIKKKMFGKSIGLSAGAGYDRIREPSRLTVADLRRMKLTAEELQAIVG